MESRNTIQRSLVEDAVHCLNHPTAEEVYTYISTLHPSVSKATVYRNLGVLVEKGMLRKVGLPDGADCFDITVADHYHIRCKKCGLVADVDLPYCKNLNALIKNAAGFVVEGHELIIRGLCPACAELNSQAD